MNKVYARVSRLLIWQLRQFLWENLQWTKLYPCKTDGSQSLSQWSQEYYLQDTLIRNSLPWRIWEMLCNCQRKNWSSSQENGRWRCSLQQDMRGRHQNQATKLLSEAQEAVIDYVSSYQASESHYRRARKYFESNMSMRKMWWDFCKKSVFQLSETYFTKSYM